ncbi:glycosyltransferase [Bifidobacterium sp. ESL0800]|uniref:glycosyltransferase family 32 protein n=1 Tax=Bifidobacterium sp. ESL0800 TaxID=2983236 RepID=UPI0023F7D29D|nr:glycosyltransferase [Bifidobacterium sp. ESL0800]WEV75638.1 glycosyltransferase [Bifidobacterium sp. ESL0800]
MIPKVIHYIWFGGKPLPALAEKCLASWKKYCPDYEIVRWDESNFDFSQSRYCREAYEAKKWAFVSDYARLWVLVHEGGIYMDTDVEVLSSLDKFLSEKAFSGFESKTKIPTGLMASERGFPLFARLLADYDNRTFVNPDGSFNLTTNVTYITDACIEKGLILNGEKQTIDGFTLYPSDFFCPKDFETSEINLTKNSCTIHHFNGSWIPSETAVFLRWRRDIIRTYPWIPHKIVSFFALLCACWSQRNFKPFVTWFNNKRSK